MLTKWIVEEKQVKYLTVILWKVKYDDDQKQMSELCTNSINKWKNTNWKERSKNRADRKKSINEAKSALDCGATEKKT